MKKSGETAILKYNAVNNFESEFNLSINKTLASGFIVGPNGILYPFYNGPSTTGNAVSSFFTGGSLSLGGSNSPSSDS